jgi:hypothetical protein
MKKDQPSSDAIDWDARATEALEKARLMPPGQEKAEALKKAILAKLVLLLAVALIVAGVVSAACDWPR